MGSSLIVDFVAVNYREAHTSSISLHSSDVHNKFVSAHLSIGRLHNLSAGFERIARDFPKGSGYVVMFYWVDTMSGSYDHFWEIPERVCLPFLPFIWRPVETCWGITSRDLGRDPLLPRSRRENQVIVTVFVCVCIV